MVTSIFRSNPNPRWKQLYEGVLVEQERNFSEDGREIVLLKRIARVEMSILKRALLLGRHQRRENEPERRELVDAANTLCRIKVGLLRQAIGLDSPTRDSEPIAS